VQARDREQVSNVRWEYSLRDADAVHNKAGTGFHALRAVLAAILLPLELSLTTPFFRLACPLSISVDKNHDPLALRT